MVLVGSEYWKGLTTWIRDTLLAEGKISPDDVDLVTITDSPEEAVRVVVDCYEHNCSTTGRRDLRKPKPGTAEGTPASPEKADAQ